MEISPAVLLATNYQPINNNQPPTSEQVTFKQALNVAHMQTIQRGDTLSELAIKHHTTVGQLATINHISNPDVIYAGTQLQIPVVPTSRTSNPLNSNGTTTLIGMPTSTTTAELVPTLDSIEKIARDYIVTHESHGSYTARNGRYIGKYQLDQNYLNGDFSPANQERVAHDYVLKRYGSWTNAMNHWKNHQWY